MPKKKGWKKRKFLNQNHGLTALEKSQFFDVLKFWILKPRNTFSWPILPKRKTWKNGNFFDQKHGLAPLEKSQFLDFLKFLFYGVENRFFVLEYRKTHFPGLYCLKRKLEKWSFLDQNHGLTHLEKSQFFDFFNLLF